MGQRLHIRGVSGMSASPPTPVELMRCGERRKGPNCDVRIAASSQLAVKGSNFQ